ncbi:MAG: alpha-hydroxy acid oxidase, partial [Acidimicrobiia bacterium]
PLVVPPEVEFVHLARDPAQRGIDRKLSWDVLEWIRQESSLPIVLKGVLHPEDGRIASEQGVDALIVSNHGGRQLDSAVSAYDVLGSFLDAVDDRVQVYADGGIRSGNDLLKVLALGARAGLVGRPIWWGLASAGQAGVGRVLELIRTELEETMRLCGVSSVDLISSEILFDAR